MFGGIELSLLEIVLTFSSLVALVTDLLWGKIYNILTFSLVFSGLAYSVAEWHAVGSILGILTAFALFGWIFKVGHLGGGDVKFLMGVGAWAGPKFTLEVALLSILLGGLFSVGVLLYKGRFFSFGRKLFLSLQSLLIPELEFQSIHTDKKLRMPFGIPLAIATVWTLLKHPFFTWGMIL